MQRERNMISIYIEKKIGYNKNNNNKSKYLNQKHNKSNNSELSQLDFIVHAKHPNLMMAME